ncbi:MAG: hypothetical protein ABI646_01270 [Acidobacteriota bacterium]
MTYFVYFLFVVWLLTGLGGFLAGALLRFGPAEVQGLSSRPAWYHFLSGVYTLSVAGLLFWLYSYGTLTELWVLMIGTVVFLPELLFLAFSKWRS